MVYAAQLHTGLGTAAVTTVLFCIPTHNRSRWRKIGWACV